MSQLERPKLFCTILSCVLIIARKHKRESHGPFAVNAILNCLSSDYRTSDSTRGSEGAHESYIGSISGEQELNELKLDRVWAVDDSIDNSNIIFKLSVNVRESTTESDI